ncbi:MAG TPA: DUF2249 domain-containing protein [Candidatus Limnocylindria bacterium]
MREPADALRDALADALVAALRRLGTAGEPVEASRLAARAYASTRRDAPRLAQRLDGVMHHLARLEAAATQSERSHHVTDAQILDVRQEPPIRRHGLIFETFERLPVGTSFELVNDHDPKPLYYQLAAEQGGTFSWDYLEQGPVVWRVRIGRTAPADEAPSTGRGEELEMAGPGTAS